jgi:hypothetical protein
VSRRKELDNLDFLLREKERKLSSDLKANDERDQTLRRAEDAMQHAPPHKLQKTVPGSTTAENCNPQNTSAHSTQNPNATNLCPQSALFKTLANDNLFSHWERMLFAACECALADTDTSLHCIAEAIVHSRITQQQIATHAIEIGIEEDLRIAMVRNIRGFAQFMYTAQKLDIIAFGEPIQNRTLLGYRAIHILDKTHWHAIVSFACEQGCFGAKSTIYEMLLRFGFGAVIGAKTRKHNGPGTSTDKKNDVLLKTNPLVFNQERLESNLKRYTNGQTRPKSNYLLVLATAANATQTVPQNQ